MAIEKKDIKRYLIKHPKYKDIEAYLDDDGDVWIETGGDEIIVPIEMTDGLIAVLTKLISYHESH